MITHNKMNPEIEENLKIDDITDITDETEEEDTYYGRCKADNCKWTSIYNYPCFNGTVYCSSHKQQGMVLK